MAPPLTDMASRMYIAGVLTNTPEHMVRWIQDPPAIDSATAMPDVGVSERDARDIAANLYAIGYDRDPCASPLVAGDAERERSSFRPGRAAARQDAIRVFSCPPIQG